jgi:diguanylate cyclase
LEKNLAGALAHKEASQESGRRLEVDVSAKVVDIKATVHNASNLHDLKSTIAGRLDGINSYIQEYRHQEEQRLHELENELIQVNGKLQLAEQETCQLRQRLKEQYKKALIDPLTEINNRVAYDEHIIKEYARWKRYDIPLTLLIIDVDHFKHINDTYGHKAGDMALKYIAQVLKSNLRETDFICRYGGEEFAVFISDIAHEKILDVAEKLRIAIEECNFHYQGTRVTITISCGIAFYNGDDTPETVFKRADNALYKAKENGRNRCCIEDE